MKKMCKMKSVLGLDNSVTVSPREKTVTTMIRSGSSSSVVKARRLERGDPGQTGRLITNPLDTRPDIIYHTPHNLDDQHYEVVEQ